MIVAIASGKGGTGKTTVTAALARLWSGRPVVVDLDVEAPNLHLFLHPDLARETVATLEVPVADPALCDGCRACSDICAFKAIAVFGNFPATFSEMCHGCGACLEVCPHGALKPGTRVLGHIAEGSLGGGNVFLMGRLRVGEAMSPPLMRVVRQRIRALVKQMPRDVLIDAPPGTSCPAIEAVRDADVVVLVTEPTPFGLYDLDLARRAFSDLGKPLAVVVNRSAGGDCALRDYCRENNLPILDALPFERAIAETYARGGTYDSVGPDHHARIKHLVGRIRAFARQEHPAEPIHA